MYIYIFVDRKSSLLTQIMPAEDSSEFHPRILIFYIKFCAAVSIFRGIDGNVYLVFDQSWNKLGKMLILHKLSIID